MISELVGHVCGKSLERIQKLSVGETASILQGLSRSGYMLKNSWNQNKVIDIFYKEHILNRIIAGNFSDDTLCFIYSVYNWKQLWCSAWLELHCLCRQLRFPPASTTSQSSCHTSPSYSWATNHTLPPQRCTTQIQWMQFLWKWSKMWCFIWFNPVKSKQTKRWLAKVSIKKQRKAADLAIINFQWFQ